MSFLEVPSWNAARICSMISRASSGDLRRDSVMSLASRDPSDSASGIAWAWRAWPSAPLRSNTALRSSMNPSVPSITRPNASMDPLTSHSSMLAALEWAMAPMMVLADRPLTMASRTSSVAPRTEWDRAWTTWASGMLVRPAMSAATRDSVSALLRVFGRCSRVMSSTPLRKWAAPSSETILSRFLLRLLDRLSRRRS